MYEATMVVKRFLLISAACLLGASAALAQPSGPDQTVKAVLNDTISDIQKAKAVKGKAWNQRAVINLIEQNIAPHFDFTRMTALAVGRSWREASSAQKTALAREFHRMIVRTYSNTVLDYQNEIIDVLPLSEADTAKTDLIVRTRVNLGGGKGPVKIDLAVQKKGGGWKVYDVVVSGVSIVMNFRETFNSEIKQNGIDGLIASLADKNNKSDAKIDGN